MTTKRDFTRIIGVLVAAAFTQALVASPAMAVGEAENDCVCIVAGGTTGVVTGASGWVKLNGDVGLVDASMNAPLSLGSVLRTGVAGSATATVGDGCNVNVAALSQMSISALEDGRMCVRLTDESTTGAVDSGGAIALGAGGAVLATTLVVVGLGQEDPVSK